MSLKEDVFLEISFQIARRIFSSAAVLVTVLVAYREPGPSDFLKGGTFCYFDFQCPRSLECLDNFKCGQPEDKLEVSPNKELITASVASTEMSPTAVSSIEVSSATNSSDDYGQASEASDYDSVSEGDESLSNDSVSEGDESPSNDSASNGKE